MWTCQSGSYSLCYVLCTTYGKEIVCVAFQAKLKSLALKNMTANEMFKNLQRPKLDDNNEVKFCKVNELQSLQQIRSCNIIIWNLLWFYGNQWRKFLATILYFKRICQLAIRFRSLAFVIYRYLIYKFKQIKICKVIFICIKLDCSIICSSHLNCYSFILYPLSYREDRGGRSPRRVRNTPRFSATSGSSAGSTPRQDQARSEM